ncbi:unnamed protein product [Vitrella brassicaformis CCMP3155]|uniref:Acid phosphatase n=2 Tax=Vitrella brassicaformis TaxID=1169539 RepID=A0A0G4FTA5_VITBC|nr:unnamed protein product [Vitrella brassicaformis CCMP3155]|eukprot:CEM17861.1 unnamed protein product [Vitrella brassicaformis CCMP3155]
MHITLLLRPLAASLLAAVALLAAAPCVSGEAELKRAIMLSRHGNRVPNEPTIDFCPAYKSTLEKFYGASGQLTGVGMSEMYQLGAWARHRYVYEKGFLPQHYSDDNTLFFQSELEDRNIMSTVAFGNGLFPDGTGPRGYLGRRPQVLPIQSVTPGYDDLFNSPRDGMCIGRSSKDKKEIAKHLEATLTDEQRSILRKVGEACSYNVLNVDKMTHGAFTLPDWVKIIDDSFLFAETESFDMSLDGNLLPKDLKAFHDFAFDWMMYAFFGTEEQVTYWAGRFPAKLMELFESTPGYKTASEEGAKEGEGGGGGPLAAAAGNPTKMYVFLNHRELLYAVLKLFDVPVTLPGHIPSYLVTASTIVWEVYQEGDEEPYVKTLIWWPTDLEEGDLDKDTNPLINSKGNYIEVTPTICESLGGKCPVSKYKEAFQQWVETTGSYKQLCLPYYTPPEPHVAGQLLEVDSAADVTPNLRGSDATTINQIFA